MYSVCSHGAPALMDARYNVLAILARLYCLVCVPTSLEDCSAVTNMSSTKYSSLVVGHSGRTYWLEYWSDIVVGHSGRT